MGTRFPHRDKIQVSEMYVENFTNNLPIKKIDHKESPCSSPVKRSLSALGKSAIIIATRQGAKRTWLLKGMGHDTLIDLLNDTPMTHP